VHQYVPLGCFEHEQLAAAGVTTAKTESAPAKRRRKKTRFMESPICKTGKAYAAALRDRR
jgi:hypothetical protein